INFMWRNPLIGPVIPGDERFPDMSRPYDPELQALAVRVALDARIPVDRGVYCAVPGPSYETPAEIRMLQRFGADLVGMSTVPEGTGPEVLAARGLGVPRPRLSPGTNLRGGPAPRPPGPGGGPGGRPAAGPRLRTLLAGTLREIQRLPDVELA